MASLPTGKGMFLWRIKDCGTPEQIATIAERMGLSYVMIKVANGISNYNLRPISLLGVTTYVDDIIQPVVDALHKRGIAAWGWQYIYLNSPIAEAQVAAARINKFKLDGFVVNAETYCKNKPVQMAVYFSEYRRLVPNLVTGMSSYRYPVVHYTFPWKEALAKVDFAMPQVYWIQAHNPAEQLAESVRQYKALYTKIGQVLPIIPTGAAFEENGWIATNDEVNAFHLKSRELAKAKEIAPSNNWWELSQVIKHNFVPAIESHYWSFFEEPGTPVTPGVPVDPNDPTKPLILPRLMEIIAPSGVKLRTSPVVPADNSNLIGGLGIKARPMVVEVRKEGENIWGKLSGENLWMAIRYDGISFAKFVS